MMMLVTILIQCFLFCLQNTFGCLQIIFADSHLDHRHSLLSPLLTNPHSDTSVKFHFLCQQILRGLPAATYERLNVTKKLNLSFITIPLSIILVIIDPHSRHEILLKRSMTELWRLRLWNCEESSFTKRCRLAKKDEEQSDILSGFFVRWKYRPCWSR